MIDADGLLRTALLQVAPEANLDALEPHEDLQDALDLDSMDFLNFLIALAHETGVEIPESDYDQVRTYADCRAYVERRATA
jgi:acyl carrier protein